MESIKKQTYKNIITIVHTDDPRDKYVGDIIIEGYCYSPEYGGAPYNLYNNRLLQAIPPGDGYYHFMDDDDEYFNPDVISILVEKSKKDHINIGHVVRWNGIKFPKQWRIQKSFQTECFFLHTDHKGKAKWWPNKGGDHDYSKKLTRILPINWIDDLIISKAQEGKGHGKKIDKGGRPAKRVLPPETKVPVLFLRRNMSGKRAQWGRQGEFKIMTFHEAESLERQGKVKITNYATNIQEKVPVRNFFQV